MGQVIALDSMVFIYLLEEDERYFEKVSVLFEDIEAGKVGAVTSIVSPIEVLSSPKLSGQNEMRTEIVRFFQESKDLLVFETNYEIGLLAAELRRDNMFLRTPDAIQLATAIVGGAKLFVTNDIKLKKIKVDFLEIRMIDELNV